jgi:hypothetical protein
LLPTKTTELSWASFYSPSSKPSKSSRARSWWESSKKVLNKIYLVKSFYR